MVIKTRVKVKDLHVIPTVLQGYEQVLCVLDNKAHLAL